MAKKGGKKIKTGSLMHDEIKYLKDIVENASVAKDCGSWYIPEQPKKEPMYQDVVLLKKYMELEATLQKREETIAWMSRLLDRKRGNQFTGG